MVWSFFWSSRSLKGGGGTFMNVVIWQKSISNILICMYVSTCKTKWEYIWIQFGRLLPFGIILENVNGHTHWSFTNTICNSPYRLPMHEALVRAVSQRECIYFFVCSACTSNFFFRHDMGKTNAKSLLFL